MNLEKPTTCFLSLKKRKAAWWLLLLLLLLLLAKKLNYINTSPMKDCSELGTLEDELAKYSKIGRMSWMSRKLGSCFVKDHWTRFFSHSPIWMK